MKKIYTLKALFALVFCLLCSATTWADNVLAFDFDCSTEDGNGIAIADKGISTTKTPVTVNQTLDGVKHTWQLTYSSNGKTALSVAKKQDGAQLGSSNNPLGEYALVLQTKLAGISNITIEAYSNSSSTIGVGVASSAAATAVETPFLEVAGGEATVTTTSGKTAYTFSLTTTPAEAAAEADGYVVIYGVNDAKYIRISSITINYSGESEEVPTAKQLPFETSLLTADEYNEFDVNNEELGNLSYVWKRSGSYGAVASGYASNTSNETRSYFISPLIDLTNVEEAKLTFEHAGNKFGAEGVVQDYCHVLLNPENTGDWFELEVPIWPTGTSWDFVNSGEIDLTQQCGQNVRIAFLYTSDENVAGTWEIKNLKVEEGAAAAVMAPEITPAAGTYNEKVEVTISAAFDTYTIYYTLNGEDPVPGENTTVYSGPFTLWEDATVKAIAEDEEGQLSEIVTAEYTVVRQGQIGYDLPFEETFAESLGAFAINDINWSADNTPVWTNSSSSSAAFVKATSYVGGANNDADSWLISPRLNLTEVKGATLTFEHAINKYFGDVTTEATVWVREAGANEWEKQLKVTYPEKPTSSYSAFVKNEIGLNAFAGKVIEIGFHYVGTTTTAGTWDIMNFSVVDNGGIAPVEAPEFTPESGTYESSIVVAISAEEGATIFYTLDGTDPTTESTEFTGRFTLTETTTVKAIAVIMTTGATSPISTAVYQIVTPEPEGFDVVTDFSEDLDLPYSSNREGEADKGNVTEFNVNGINFFFPESEGESGDDTFVATHARLWESTTGTGDDLTVTGHDLRIYTNQRVTLTCPTGRKILGVIFYANASNYLKIREASSESDIVVQEVSDEETLIRRKADSFKAVWAADDATAGKEVTFIASGQSRLVGVDVILDGDLTGVTTVKLVPATNDNLYDLQGRKVTNAAQGLYILNGKKVYIK